MPESDTQETTPREAFRQRQRASLDYYFSLTEGEETVREHFERMALRTYDELPDTNKPSYSFSIEAHSAFNFAHEQDHIHEMISLDLVQNWKSWEKAYDGLLNRNPRLALHDFIHWIGETHDYSSWPYGLEPAISDWIDGGQREPIPFDDRQDIVTPDFYERLRHARREAGGFFVFESEAGTVFLPEAEWQRKKRTMAFVAAGRAFEAAHAEEKARRLQAYREEEAARKADPIQRRVAKILVLARGEPDFWEALRAWERDREARRPAAVSDGDGRLAGPIAIRRRTDPVSATGGNPPVAIPLDPLLADFIERIRAPEDDEIGLTTPFVVAILRGTVRDELGYDGTLVWPGGPSLGEGRP